ncbi:hypothetical protein Trydic_g15317 [Trypoxylus dichotomus]
MSGNKPTFVTVSRTEVIDVTVCTLRFARWVKHWHVSDEPSLSDHRYIRFDIELQQVSKMSYRNPGNCTWDAYRERLIEELERCPRRIKTAVDIELLAERLQSAIITSYEASCPVKIRSTNRDTPWWTRELSELRTATRKLYNKCKKSDSWDEYKASLTKATLAVAHLPSSWREARVVFIPKQGKTFYTEAKSYRPISLTSFLLKTLEKIIDNHLRDPALGRLPLHENQYAYQSGKSCEQAIHELARRAETAFRHKEIALATFPDIEGAFDRASFLSMERALQRRGVEPTLTRATVATGCTQGGVLSDPRRTGFYAQGYADDITIMVSGRFEGVVSERMQVALRLVETWCRKEGLNVN